MTIEFVEYTPEMAKRLQRSLAAMTRAEVVEYAERKMMPTRYMLGRWKQARKAQRETKGA